ncbi:MAG TPA: glycerol-3-phosphate 1-O-acyltransferase PlsY, partial [Candidatus Polarisedimenticolia bacterium]|nr:glycerol-3-phosphate 1-O-acyltransferase PlsY [Candidatus Polarisedimenticolia bacterium]
TGYILLRALAGKDIRAVGSGNVGATNALRAGGRLLGAATLLLDAGKGAAAVALVRAVTGDSTMAAAAAIAAVAGHCYPVYLRFRGGKGIATGCGAFGLLAPVPMALALLGFLIVVAATRMVSAGSIAAGISLPLLILWLSTDRALAAAAAATALIAVWRHGENIRRIITGKERRLDGS